MRINKNRLRKIYGIEELDSNVDPRVFSRRKYHIAAAVFSEKWMSSVNAFFALIGFFVVLLPVLVDSWRVVFVKYKILSVIYDSYSSFSGLLIVHFNFLVVVFLIRVFFQIRSKDYLSSKIFWRSIVDMELYPKNLNEELFFWVEIFCGFFSSTLILVVPFGAIAFFILLGR